MAAALRPRRARVPDDRYEQDRQAHARAPEVPARPVRRRRAVRARSRRGRVPTVHGRGRVRAARRPRASGPRPLLGPLMDLSFTAEEEAFATEIREWLRANLDTPSD